jgi:hypothetical protein
VGRRADLDDMGKLTFLTLPGLGLRTLGRPARSQSLYRLSITWQYQYNLVKAPLIKLQSFWNYYVLTDSPVMELIEPFS